MSKPIYYQAKEWEVFREKLMERTEDIAKSFSIVGSGWLLALCEARGFLTREEKEKIKSEEHSPTKQTLTFVDLLGHKLDVLHILIYALEDHEVRKNPTAFILREILWQVRPDWEEYVGSSLAKDDKVLIRKTREPLPGFVGRTGDKVNIDSKFSQYCFSTSSSKRLQAVVITGMAEADRSALATEFLRSHKKRLAGCHVLWIPAASKDSIRNTFVTAYEEKFPGASLRNEGGSLKSDNILMTEIYDQLCQRRTVIIFDNAAFEKEVNGSEGTIQDFICNEASGAAFLPFYIITTRTLPLKVWKRLREPSLVHLDCFTAEESWKYMSTYLSFPNINEYEADLKELSEFFNHLRFAIEHCVKLMMWEYVENKDEYDPRKFIAETMNSIGEQAEELGKVDPYEKLRHMWGCSIKKLIITSPFGSLVKQILEIMAILSTTGVSHQFLQTILIKYNELTGELDDTEFESKLASSLSLVEVFSVTRSSCKDYCMQVPLQEYLRDEMEKENRLEEHVKNVALAMTYLGELASFKAEKYASNLKNLECICRALLTKSETRSENLKIQCAKLVEKCLPNVAIALLEPFVEDYPAKAEDTASSTDNELCSASEVIRILSNCYIASTQYEKAISLIKAYEKQECDEDPALLNNVGLAHFHSGRYDDALLHFEKAHKKVSCQPGQTISLEDLSAISNMAACYSELENFERALEVSKQIYATKCKKLGEYDLSTLKTMHNMAQFHFKLCNFNEALRLSKQVYERRSELLGDHDPDTLSSLNNLASYYAEAGNFKEALRLSEKFYEAQCKLLSRTHPITTTCLNNIATYHSKAGNHKLALSKGQEIFEIRKSSSGPKHPETLTAENNLAIFHASSGNFPMALQLSQQVYETRREVLGSTHPDTLASANNLASNHAKMGDYKNALRLSQQILVASQDVLGENHLHMITCMSNMASYHSELGNYLEALRLSKKIYDVQRKTLGDAHPDTLVCLSNMAGYLAYNGEVEEALRLTQQVYETQSKKLGPEHPNTLRSMDKIAGYQSKLGHFKEALRLSKEAYNLQRKIAGSGHPDTLLFLQNLAYHYSQMGNYKAALAFCEQAYEKQCQVHGRKHLSTAENLASYQAKMGDYKGALCRTEEILVEKKEKLGEDHPDTITCMSNMAVYHENLGNYKEALQISERVCDILTQIRREDHPTTLSCLFNKATCLFNMKNFSEALVIYEKVLHIASKVFGDNHPTTLTFKENVSMCYLETGNAALAESLSLEVLASRVQVLGAGHPDTEMTKKFLRDYFGRDVQ